MEAFPKLVHDALFEVDNVVRSAAEKKVSDFLSAEPSKFLQFTVAELANENNSEALRQACGTLFVRALRVQVICSLLILYVFVCPVYTCFVVLGIDCVIIFLFGHSLGLEQLNFSVFFRCSYIIMPS